MVKPKKEKTEQKKVELGPLTIISASLIAGHVNYSYVENTGVRSGSEISVKGPKPATQDLLDRFMRLNVHQAIMDDAFFVSGVDLGSIDEARTYELCNRYSTNSIKITGGFENESIVISGSKALNSVVGRGNVSSPRVPVDANQSYKWYNELKEDVEALRKEVELYHNGKYFVEESNQLPVPFEGEVNLEVAEVK